MLITAVIPTIGRSTLARAALSLTEQGFSPEELEIIVINDSGKPLPEEEWQTHPQIRIITTNRAERSLACNVGAALGRGKYVKFLHDDDYLLPGALRTLYDLAESAPESAVWFYGALNCVDNDDNFLFTNSPGPEVSGNIHALFTVPESMHIAPCIIRRDAFLKVGGFDPRLALAEDTELGSKLSLIGTFARTDTVVANVRVGQVGSTTDWSRARVNIREVRERIFAAPGAVARIRASFAESEALRTNPRLRGKTFRTCVVIGAHHLKSGNILTGLSRLLVGLRLSGYYLAHPTFWKSFLNKDAAPQEPVTAGAVQ